MKKTITFLTVLFFSTIVFGQTHELIWEESFNGYQIPTGIEGLNDSDSGTNASLNLGDYNESFTKWTLDSSEADLQNFADYAIVQRTSANLDPHLRIQDSGGDGIHWITENIDLNGYSNIAVSMLIEETGDHEESDFIDVFYSVDDGVNYTRIPNWKNHGNDTHTLTGNDSSSTDSCYNDDDFKKQMIYFNVPDSANTVKLKITFKNGSSSENFLLDDVKIYGTSDTASVNDSIISNMEVFPNPSNGNVVNIKSDSNIQSISIYSLQGKLFSSIKNINKIAFEIDTKQFTNGVYFISVTMETNHNYIQKLIIQK